MNANKARKFAEDIAGDTCGHAPQGAAALPEAGQGKYWYAAYVGSNKELLVRNRLADMDCDVCVPVKKEIRRKNRKNILKDVPLLRSYVFFICPPGRIVEVRDTPDVSYVLKEAGMYSPYAKIPDADICRLQRACEEASDSISFEWGNLPSGTRVKVFAGKLKGIEGEIFLWNENKTTLYLRVGFLGCATVEVDAGNVKVIP